MISTPLYVIIIGAEVLLSHLHHTRSYTVKNTLHNFYFSVLAGLVDLLMRGVGLAVLSFVYIFRLFPLSHSIIYWVSLLLLVDMMHYWLHRLSHTCRLFWAVHVNHHSSEQFNFTVGFRAGVLEPLYRFLIFIPLAWAGFQPIDILLVYSAGELWAVCTHTEKLRRLGWLEYVMVTPSHHRVHHASNPKYLDRNLGSVFIIWDRLFGTFQPELPPSAYEPLRYGLTKPLESYHAAHLVFHEWVHIWHDVKRRDITWKQRLMYIFGPPGWSHDGSRCTSDQLREKEISAWQERHGHPASRHIAILSRTSRPSFNDVFLRRDNN